MKLGICEWNIPLPCTLDRIQWAAEAGLQGIEIDLGNHQEGLPTSHRPQQEKLLAMAAEHQIELPTLGLNACCEYSMGHPKDRDIIERAFIAGIETALAMNIPTLQVPSFGASWIDTDEQLQHTIECFKFACRQAQGTPLLIGTENALTAEQQLHLLEEVGSEQFKIYFDTRNAFWMKGLNSAAILKKLLPHLCEVHVKDGLDDGPSCPLSEGNSGVDDCMHLLKQAHYDGWYLLENDYLTTEICQQDIKYMHRYLER